MHRVAESWQIGPVEIPGRIVLAPMAGVSVQAFRRQGRRFGAGLVCSEMVSACGLAYANERTLGYLRIARDEHPLAVQIFGSEPERMAEAAEMVVAAGADIVDINFGCPVRKVTKTGAGASALEDHDLACRLAGAVVDAVDVPVTVKMRRGVRNGSRTALELGPKLEARGVSALTLHPRSAQQMYTGTADHALTAELVDRVGIPVMASGDITDRTSAERVLDETGAAAVMVGRGAQGRPWALREMAGGDAAAPATAEVVAELVRFMREVVREMGEERSVGFLRKFYGWYLRGLPGAKEVRGNLMACAAVADAEDVLLDFCPEARVLLAEHEAQIDALPDTDTDRLLDLPISIYGGG
ncbi:MAG: tRNA dihydrouridine synthase DusB [Gaiellales bacterium]